MLLKIHSWPIIRATLHGPSRNHSYFSLLDKDFSSLDKDASAHFCSIATRPGTAETGKAKNHTKECRRHNRHLETNIIHRQTPS
jgi:hypothetical protein